MVRSMINELIKLANHLDSKGFNEEADYLDVLIEKVPPSAVLEGKTSDKLLSLDQVYKVLNSLRGELEHQAASSYYGE